MQSSGENKKLSQGHATNELEQKGRSPDSKFHAFFPDITLPLTLPSLSKIYLASGNRDENSLCGLEGN